jgi:hypothetical protein
MLALYAMTSQVMACAPPAMHDERNDEDPNSIQALRADQRACHKAR